MVQISNKSDFIPNRIYYNLNCFIMKFVVLSHIKYVITIILISALLALPVSYLFLYINSNSIMFETAYKRSLIVILIILLFHQDYQQRLQEYKIKNGHKIQDD